MSKKEQLKQLFDERKQAYEQASSTILDQLKTVVSAIDEYFIDQKEVDEKRHLKWDQVGYAEPHNMLMLLGAIHYSVGAQVTIETGVVTVTEELAPYFQRTIRVGMPLDMVDESKENIKEFLKRRDEENAEEQTDAAKFILDLLALAKEKAGVEEDDIEEDTEFDLESLSDDQRKGLIVSKQGKPN